MYKYMAVWTYEDVVPSLIENTIIQKGFGDGVHRIYKIMPMSGYVLHDKGRDWTETDILTGEETFYRGYTTGATSCPVSYDFANNPREFYVIPKDEVPKNQVFG